MLSNEDIEKFRRVLERTTLDSIIKLSAEVTDRLQFLSVLHELTYGEFAKHLRERTQLHRILEPHCWVFGQRYHLAASDRNFREIVRRHREKAGLTAAPEINLKGMVGADDIPDLFLAATRDYPHDPKHNHVLVEIKAPKVALGRKEVEQIRRYAETILQSSEFDQRSTQWDLYLISARASEEIARDRKQKNLPLGCLWQWDTMNVWAFEWSEIISDAREELQLVRNHLENKSKELSVSDFLRENFPEILSDLEAKLTG
jgi:hypothetical protein